MRIKFNANAFYDIRRSPGVVGALDSQARRVADSANMMGKGTYATGSRQGAKRPQGRWRASVVTADARAITENAKNNTLLKALGRR